MIKYCIVVRGRLGRGVAIYVKENVYYEEKVS